MFKGTPNNTKKNPSIFFNFQLSVLLPQPHIKWRFFILPLVLVIISCGTGSRISITPSEEAQVDEIRVTPSLHNDWWHPAPGLSWQWILHDQEVDISIGADVYDVDLYTNQSVINSLHDRGVKVICYISVGSWEDWRPDADQFPQEIIGNAYEGWSGERWLDIRQIDLLAPIMRARLDSCASKGFDGIEPDNLEVYSNDSGFPITYTDQLTYARWLAEEAHARGLAIGIKNAPDMVNDALAYFDFAITEDCFFFDWCGDMLPFIENGKAVFAAEYTDMDVDFDAACNWQYQYDFSFILKDRDLDNWIEICK